MGGGLSVVYSFCCFFLPPLSLEHITQEAAAEKKAKPYQINYYWESFTTHACNADGRYFFVLISNRDLQEIVGLSFSQFNVLFTLQFCKLFSFAWQQSKFVALSKLSTQYSTVFVDLLSEILCA